MEVGMRKRLTHAMIALPAALVSLPALAQTTTDQSKYWHYGMGWGWGHMFFGSFMMVLFWGSIIVLIVVAVRYLVRGSSHGAMPPASRGNALGILEERFARGEIDKEEFEERRRLLSD